MRTGCAAVLLLAAALAAAPAEARRRKGKAPPAHGEQAAQRCPARCENGPLFAEAPEPDAIDAEVLGLCPTRAGGRVEPEDVRAFFEKHLDDQRLLGAVREAAPWANHDSGRAGWLAGIWSGPARRNAFTHLLCGDDWEKDEPGGVHLEARFAQLEREGKICYRGPAGGGPAHDGQPCAGGVCLVRYRGLRGFSCGEKERGGFAQGLDALDLLAAGTRAYVACCMGGSLGDRLGQDDRKRLRNGGRYAGPRGITFQSWCGERNGRFGIASFYPAPGTADCGP